jgi:hypothetical protein
MSVNFLKFGDEGERGEPPNRIYARIDRVEPEVLMQTTPVTAVFDGVDAYFFDHTHGSFAIEKAPLSVVEIDFPNPDAAPPEITLEEGGGWVQLRLTDQQTDTPVRQYTNLFTVAIKRYLENASIVHPKLARELDRAVSMDTLPDARREDIAQALAVDEPLIGAAVYDVGQGGCHAFLGDSRFPRVYFDFGGGVLNNTFTFPNVVKGLCTTREPPVILSHLDWDHWSSAQRFAQAPAGCWKSPLGLTWIMPRQECGFTHRRFMAEVLTNDGRLLIWPANLFDLTVGQITIEKCTGSGRNHSGLAAVLTHVAGPEHMLFTGDARYTAIPSVAEHEFVAVVAPHHGGNTRNRYVPRTAPGGDPRVAYSFGPNNSYRHPSDQTIQRHQLRRRLDTANRQPNGSQGNQIPGHIGVFFSRAARFEDPPCRGNLCTMQLAQF